MFKRFRDALSLPPPHDILDHIHSLSPADQEAAFAKIRAIESEAMSQQQPQPGLVELMTYLESRSIPKGICTRNFDAPVEHLLGKFLEGKTFAPVVTR
jgi:beta-phosphoglucomutase-like phosphatase (HAD superfamily)